jgi:hypothetical protein
MTVVTGCPSVGSPSSQRPGRVGGRTGAADAPPGRGILSVVVRATGKGSVATCDSSRSVACCSPGC